MALRRIPNHPRGVRGLANESRTDRRRRGSGDRRRPLARRHRSGRGRSRACTGRHRGRLPLRAESRGGRCPRRAGAARGAGVLPAAGGGQARGRYEPVPPWLPQARLDADVRRRQARSQGELQLGHRARWRGGGEPAAKLGGGPGVGSDGARGVVRGAESNAGSAAGPDAGSDDVHAVAPGAGSNGTPAAGCGAGSDDEPVGGPAGGSGGGPGGEGPSENPLLGPNVWPAAMPALKPAVYPCFEAASACAEDLLRGFALGAGLDAEHFIRLRDRPLSRGSLQYYPPQPDDAAEDQFGVAPHTDFGVLTVLCQDEIGGLEIQRRNGSWAAMPPIPRHPRRQHRRSAGALVEPPVPFHRAPRDQRQRPGAPLAGARLRSELRDPGRPAGVLRGRRDAARRPPSPAATTCCGGSRRRSRTAGEGGSQERLVRRWRGAPQSRFASPGTRRLATA